MLHKLVHSDQPQDCNLISIAGRHYLESGWSPLPQRSSPPVPRSEPTRRVLHHVTHAFSLVTRGLPRQLDNSTACAHTRSPNIWASGVCHPTAGPAAPARARKVDDSAAVIGFLREAKRGISTSRSAATARLKDRIFALSTPQPSTHQLILSNFFTASGLVLLHLTMRSQYSPTVCIFSCPELISFVIVRSATSRMSSVTRSSSLRRKSETKLTLRSSPPNRRPGCKSATGMPNIPDNRSSAFSQINFSVSSMKASLMLTPAIARRGGVDRGLSFDAQVVESFKHCCRGSCCARRNTSGRSTDLP